MTDFVALPGATADLPGHGGRVAQFTSAEWQQRAKVARECAADLQEAQSEIRNVLQANYFGDCVGGRRLFEGLCGVLDAWRATLADQVNSLSELAAACESAATSLDSADSKSGADLRA